MKKSFILVYSDSFGTRNEIKNFLNNAPEVNDWAYELPNCFFIISEHDASTLADSIREVFKDRGVFIIAETNENRDGLLTLKSWFLLMEKENMSPETEKIFKEKEKTGSND